MDSKYEDGVVTTKELEHQQQAAEAAPVEGETAVPTEGETSGELAAEQAAEPAPADSGTDGQEAPVETPATDPPKKDGFQARIDELTKDKYDAQRERDRLRDELEARTRPALPAEPSLPPGLEPEPQEADFEDYAGYVKSLADWSYRKAALIDQQARDQAKANQRKQQLMMDGKEKYGAEFTPYIPNALADVIMDGCTNTVDIAQHLGKNPGLIDKLMTQSPVQQAIEIGRLDANFSQPGAPKPQPQKQTAAPAPITPSGTGAAPKVLPSGSDELSMDARFKARTAERIADGFV